MGDGYAVLDDDELLAHQISGRSTLSRLLERQQECMRNGGPNYEGRQADDQAIVGLKGEIARLEQLYWDRLAG